MENVLSALDAGLLSRLGTQPVRFLKPFYFITVCTVGGSNMSKTKSNVSEIWTFDIHQPPLFFFIKFKPRC